MGAIIAVINKRGKNTTQAAVTMLRMLKPRNAEAYGIASPTTIKIEETVDRLQGRDVKSHIAIGHVFSKILKLDKPQPIKLENATIAFDGRIYPPNKELSVAEAIAKKLRQNHEEAVKNVIKENDGDFAFTVAEQERLMAGRDAMGTRPLYYGENTDLAALASERKALWKIGIKKADSFPPGHFALVDGSGFKFKPVKTLIYSKPRQTTIQAAARELQMLLKHSTEERVSGLKEAAVAFSGGLDSSIIAFLAKISGVDVHLIHVSLENKPETEYAKTTAEELKLPIHVYLYNEEEVEGLLPDVLWLIEEPDPVNASVGIPFYWAAEKTSETGFKVMLAGQGADELFGGYKRYVNDYARHGSQRVQETILNDIFRMHKTNFERDFKICNFHNVELRLPFAAFKIAKFAIDLPLELKIESTNDALRKLVLRRVAENLGLPPFIAKKPKRAMQYTTGIAKTLKKIAKRKGLPAREHLRKTFQATIEKMAQHE